MNSLVIQWLDIVYDCSLENRPSRPKDTGEGYSTQKYIQELYLISIYTISSMVSSSEGHGSRSVRIPRYLHAQTY